MAAMAAAAAGGLRWKSGWSRWARIDETVIVKGLEPLTGRTSAT
jgi:hypothetical protein